MFSVLGNADHLSGVKVLHGLDKVLEGGAVVMTLKDQSILADGDINEGNGSSFLFSLLFMYLFSVCPFCLTHQYNNL